MSGLNKKRISVFSVINILYMLLIVFLTAYPFWYALVGAFNAGMDYMRGGVYFWPREFTLENFHAVFINNTILTSFRVTAEKAILGTLGTLMITSLTAYGITRPKLMGKNVYMALILITMYFGGGLIPYFLQISRLGLYNSFWVYVLPSLFSAWYMMILMSFMRELPLALYESAKIDGAGEYRIFARIYLPLCKPVLAAVALFLVVGHWNAYFDSMMYTSSIELQTIQLFLKRIITDQWFAQDASNQAAQAMSDSLRRMTPQSIKLASMVVTAAPIIMIYPFLQRYFIKGVTIGAVKG